MNNKVKYLLLKTVQEHNIIPITSKCNLNCLFCSHRQNPPEVEVLSLGEISPELVSELLEYVSLQGPLIIGESATRLIEGEPFSHSEIFGILKLIRKKFPKREIKITTNGSYLKEKIIKKLEKFKPLELNISLNCATAEERRKFLNDSNPEIIFSSFLLLNKYNIPFHGSLVALPHIMGWGSMEKTIELLDDYNAKTIRMFLAGFTEKGRDKIGFKPFYYNQIKDFVENMNTKINTPLLLEPPFINNLKAVVQGTINTSPAEKAGIIKDDTILKINGKKPVSRVDAFHKLKINKNPDIVLMRGNKLKDVSLIKKKGKKSGLVFNYDFAPEKIDTIIEILKSHEFKRALLITSELARGILEEVVEKHVKMYFSNTEIIIKSAKNNFFGGSIMCAGLLTVEDIKNTFKKFNNLKDIDIILIPGIIFDVFGNDLTGKSYKVLEKYTNADIELV